MKVLRACLNILTTDSSFYSNANCAKLILRQSKYINLFDFGDMWRFRVELEEIRTEGTKPQEPEIIEKKRKSSQTIWIL